MDINLINLLHRNSIIKDGHWLYNGSLITGYGSYYNGASSFLVHRLSLCIYLKIDYKDHSWQACHLCEYTNCWNPLHLYQGTALTNHKDSVKAGNNFDIGILNRLRTHCSKGHELTPENTYHYKNERQCRICKRAGSNKYKQKYRKVLKDLGITRGRNRTFT